MIEIIGHCVCGTFEPAAACRAVSERDERVDNEFQNREPGELPVLIVGNATNSNNANYMRNEGGQSHSHTLATGLEARPGYDCEIAHSGEELFRGTVALLGEVALRPTMGLAARQCVLSRYSWSAHLVALEKLLDSAADSNVPHTRGR